MSRRVFYTGRRRGVRAGVPNYVNIPKFVSPQEIKTIVERKESDPSRTWKEVMLEVIRETALTKIK
jgi:hypothetical protein